MWNFSELTMEFSLEGKQAKLQGLNPTQLMEGREVTIVNRAGKKGIFLRLLKPMAADTSQVLLAMEKLLQ